MPSITIRMAPVALLPKISSLPKISDPRHVPVEPNFVERLGLAMINDARDLPFLYLMVNFTLVVLSLAVIQFFFIDSVLLGVAFSVLLYTTFFGRCILLLHNTSHRMLFKPEYWVRVGQVHSLSRFMYPDLSPRPPPQALNYYIPLVMVRTAAVI